jgi:hypothetical protein
VGKEANIVHVKLTVRGGRNRNMSKRKTRDYSAIKKITGERDRA